MKQGQEIQNPPQRHTLQTTDHGSGRHLPITGLRRISVQEEGRHFWGVGKKAERRVYRSGRIGMGPGVKGRILRG